MSDKIQLIPPGIREVIHLRYMKNAAWKRKLPLIVVIVLMINNLLSLKVFAGEENSAKIVRVGYVNFENYQEGGDGEYKRGFGYEYLQRISYSTGWQYEYVYGSFSDLLQMLKDGEIDLMGDLSYTEERAKDISFSDLPEGRENFYIYTMPDQEIIDPYELETLNGQRIGVSANSYQQGLLADWLEENGYDCTVVEYNGSSATVDALASGMAVYDKKTDHTVGDVFARADEAMYVCKKQMKKN